MTLNHAIKIGNAVNKYNHFFINKQQLDFYEVVELMDNPNDDNEVKSVIEEINKRIEIYKEAMNLYINDIIDFVEYDMIVKAL